MKKVTQLFILSFVSFLVLSCSSGKTAYKRGDYYRATTEAIDKLRVSPKSKKAQSILLQAYPMAQKAALREIQNADLANQPNKFDIIIYQYELLNQLAANIYACPKAVELIPQPTEYIAELSQAKQQGAEKAYEMGIAAVEANTIEQARFGYDCFMRANKYVYGYKDVLNKIEEALYYGTIRVIVQKPITSSNYQLSADFFYANLIAEMSQNSQNRFVRFYTQEEADKEAMRDAHHLLILDFVDFTVGNLRETVNVTQAKRDSVVVGQVQVDGKSYNAYSTVTATMTNFRREVSSGGTLGMRIVDAQNQRILQQRNFSGEYVWGTTWSTFEGDDRALTVEQKKLCQQQAQLAPPPQTMFIEFTKPIFSQAVSFVRSYYK